MSSALHATPQAFIDHWTQAEANERANSQSFLIGLTQLLGVPAPAHNHTDGYSFEFPVKVPGGQSTNFIDLYRRAHFILESKQFTAQKLEQSALEQAAIQAGAATVQKKSGPVRGTGGWDDAMIRAKGQAERYVRYLPAEEPNPPFLIVCDVGHSFEVYADFTQNGKAYLPFPDPRSFRIQLRDLADEKVRERLHLIWTNPLALDPAKISAEVTREIAGYLAELAKSLEQDGHDAEVTAQFLTRCLFCMFAEDVGLLPDRGFTELLDSVPADGTGFEELLGQLFREMNTGTGKGISVVLRKKLLQFNGGLFADHTVLPVNALQLGLLKQAASKQWKNVEPAIFGTLLERALVPEERHALGAHFTPRAYVERLVLPTVIDPLREQWANVRAAAVTHARADDLKKARKEIHDFHQQLCQIRVLDPACGSGNFLYVALQHLKILEGEVLDTAAQFGADMTLELETHAIDPHQFLGIELNPRAASIAELVLWIGYLQWHFKIHGQRTPPEPILRAFKNIECRDAVLAYDGEPQPERDADGNTVTVWDRRSTKTDLVTNREVPDETKRVPLLTYVNPRPATWPEADFIIGNPPYIGVRRLKDSIGDA
ncbi:MAG: class I SAM-dependent DNA methyltransferase, partial [Verrucomicrobia bacterium]|nr:class I SAM-dependent DNA methyltransferase [Verrucomicrobiota bacterium]